MKNLIKIIAFFASVSVYGQLTKIEFIENKGQWHENVFFKAKLPAGNLYLEQNTLTYQFYNEQDMSRFEGHHHNHNHSTNKIHQEEILHLHAFKIELLNAHTEYISSSQPTSDYENYYIGQNPLKWASSVRKFNKTKYVEPYNNIDLEFYLKDGYLKYDFIVSAGGNPEEIHLNYVGVDKLFLEKGRLNIITSVNKIIEQKPFAYQIINGEKEEVKCKFKVDGSVVSFDFPKGYDKTKKLIIDPTLVFASYSGSTSDNWGYTSTFDEDGNLYGGGVVFGTGYPTTIGAYQVSFNGGNVFGGSTDITISKFSADGTSLIYSTHIGGNGNEAPHSLIVNNSNELLIFGTTSSANYPLSVNAYDNSFNGGSIYDATTPQYIPGSDIVISKLNTTGTNLVASTYVGGSGNDGLNISDTLKYNYADDFRGEIIIDDSDNVYVASSTQSNDFPSNGGFQTALSGSQDGCVFKLTSNLDTMIWSSYIGGSEDDAAYSLQLNRLGELLITGGTTSPDFPFTPGVLNTTLQGNVDGWVAKIDNNTSTIIASSYIGTVEYDQSYFVQSDTANNIYILGQTTGSYPNIPPTVYSNPNSGQFIHKLTPDLTSTVFSTTVGTGSGEIDIALSAFLVNNCNYIFVSGWGGLTNVTNSKATSSTTTGLPITTNAVQSTTDGSDYYLMMLSEDAGNLLYGTFFGGNLSADHVDGGTSRFDKKGIVYQAVCASCGNFPRTDFPTTSGAWSERDSSTNCNLGVFKLDLTSLTSSAGVNTTTPFFCVDNTVTFENNSNGGATYFWDFGDGNTSTLFEPTHTYASTGSYNVMLIATDPATCTVTDTDFVTIFVEAPPVAVINPIGGICNGDSIQLNTSGATTYSWSPDYNISSTDSASPFVWPDTTTTYTVIATNNCGVDTSEVTVTVFQRNIGISPDTAICIGDNTQISASGGVTYLWSPIDSLNDPTIENPIANPAINTIYSVQITDVNGCIWDTSLTVIVDITLPVADLGADQTICAGDTIQIFTTDGNSFSWTPTNNLSNPFDSSTLAFPSQTTEYIVTAQNGCGTDNDTILINVLPIDVSITPDTAVCIGDSITISGFGGATYSWYTFDNPPFSTNSSFVAVIDTPTTFFLDAVSNSGCNITLSVFVDTLTAAFVDLGPNISTNWGAVIPLIPNSNGINYSWAPSEELSCLTCPNPTVNVINNADTFYLTVERNNCIASDSIAISINNSSIYLPNSFTPNGDNDNDVFYALGDDISEFEIFIFDRWGEQVFHSNDITIGWDGSYKEKLVETETYVWKIKYRDINNNSEELYGVVNLLR